MTVLSPPVDWLMTVNSDPDVQSKHGNCAQRLRRLRLEFDLAYDDDDDDDEARQLSLFELHPAFAQSRLEELEIADFRIAWDASPTWSTLRRLLIVSNADHLPAEVRLRQNHSLPYGGDLTLTADASAPPGRSSMLRHLASQPQRSFAREL